MSEISTGLEPVATFCGKCSCGCPQLFVDAGANLEAYPRDFVYLGRE